MTNENQSRLGRATAGDAQTSRAQTSGEKLICKTCGKEFIFSKGEQEFFAQKGLKNIPKSCPECREIRRKGEEPKLEVKCDQCGKSGVFRRKIEAKRVLCADCYANETSSSESK